MAAIKLARVRKCYSNGFEAVHGLDLHVADGEFMVLVGPSGCGKTTVLRMVAGLEEITSGELHIGDRIVNDLAPRDRDIAMVFQNYALYPHMTVTENVGFALKLRKIAKTEIGCKVDDALSVLGLTEWATRKPGVLSGGQRQRVAMGRAIVREPSVFLMDEPLSNLDAKLRVQMRAEVSRLQRRLGVATLYVTHDQTEAMTMGDRVAVLNAGHLQQCDAPQNLYEHPRNIFVAAFIGSPAMNLYEGQLNDLATRVQLGSQNIELPADILKTRQGLNKFTNASVVVGIRPEDLPVATGEPRSVLEGDVDLIEALGSEKLVHFSIDARRVQAEAVREEDTRLGVSGEGIARVDPRAPIVVGKRASFAIDTSRLHFFDPATGAAI